MEALDTRTFSPKELAQVVGVSESSIKRWVDDAHIHVTRTAGGHRRITLREALRFIRAQKLQVLRPDLLGLSEVAGLSDGARSGLLTGDLLFQLLRQGDATSVRGVLVRQYLNGESVAALFDGPVAEAMARMGEAWSQGDVGVYVEHIATNICIEAVNQLRLLLPPVPSDAPVALGGAPSGDPYILPSLMVATVLAEAGYRAVNLGADTPAEAWLQAVEAHAPALVWLSVTAPQEPRQARLLVSDTVRPLAASGVSVVLGGQSTSALSAAGLRGVEVMTSMEALAAFAAVQARHEQ